MKSNLTCPICSEIFQTPILKTPCQHNFCQLCLKEAIQSIKPTVQSNTKDNISTTVKIFICPVCGESNPLENDEMISTNIDVFPRNSCLEDLTEQYEVSRVVGEEYLMEIPGQSLPVSRPRQEDYFDRDLERAINLSKLDGCDYLDDAVFENEELILSMFPDLSENSLKTTVIGTDDDNEDDKEREEDEEEPDIHEKTGDDTKTQAEFSENPDKEE